ncbi:hypothetical protein ABPG77_003609 [Micractinium sp. CCAP 211/92]
MAGSQSFPKGLRVLLVAGEDRAALSAQLQCPELAYAVTAVSSSADALGLCRGGVAAFDVVLAESCMVAPDEAVGRSFVDSFEDTPVVLMAEGASTADVMRSVKLGAVDFLDKPLSLLKLKNIWQHSVRKMMMKAAGPRRSAPSSVCVNVSMAPVPVAAPSTLPPSPWATAMAAAKPAAAPSAPGAAPSLVTAVSMGPESPGTPSASADLPETYSMSLCSSGADSGAPSMRASIDCGPAGESFVEAMNSALAAGAAPLPRPTSVTSLPAASAAPAGAPAPLLPAAPSAPAHWPALGQGCVWGTPASGPIPPPLPGAHNAWASLQPPAPVLIKSSAPAPVVPAPPAPLPASSPDALAPPGDFLLADLLAPRVGGAGGPLGLKLRKSPSLLNMINTALSSESPACAGGMGLAPMLC